ncbi:unnamed protein product [Eruca vesicaria subsp. sativa]|uniref:Uncharacterized protein n=1 Tax=Eruca vesicaria subsp. sativa TaxID=29727 RepID=A0ABC8K9E2_ERUVS|nr:unnamed protein product [Eruca vesicaria subsp. sativa]
MDCQSSYASSVGVVRYRVEMIAVTREESSVFVAFDSAMTKLTNVRATKDSNPMGNNPDNDMSEASCTSCKYRVCNSSSRDTHPPEAKDQTIGPTNAEQVVSNTDQVESNGENADPQGSPPGKPI